MSPSSKLPTETKSILSTTVLDGIGKVRKRNTRESTTYPRQRDVSEYTTDMASLTSGLMNLQVANNSTLNYEEVDSIVKTVASQKLISKVTGSRHAPPAPIKSPRTRTTTKASLVVSDAAGDALAACMEKLDFTNVSPALHVRFHSYYSFDNVQISEPLIVRSSEADTLVDLGIIMLRRRRQFFRESSMTKQPPMEYSFIAKHKYITSTAPKKVMLEQYIERCQASVTLQTVEPFWGNPAVSYLRFLHALREPNFLKQLIDAKIAGVGLPCAEAKREAGPADFDELLNDKDEIWGEVEVSFR